MGSRFDGQVMLVAGGTGALGRAVVQCFLDEGATVIATRRGGDAAAAADAATPRLQVASVDVTDEPAVGALVAGIVARHGRLDALANTVGGYAGGQTLWQADAQALERMLAVNLRSAFVLCRAVVPAMLAARRGAIVNVGAKAAVQPGGGAAAYAAAKAGVLAMTASLAADLAGSGVRVNAVLPAIIDTPANRQAMPDAATAGWTRPASIARVITFLCSDEAEAVHGAAIPVYGNG